MPEKKLHGALLERFKEMTTGKGPALTAAELEELGRVTHIGDEFLSGCSDITALDLSTLCNVISHSNGNVCRNVTSG